MIRWLALLLAVLAALSLFIGDATLALPDALILWQLRLPRTLLAVWWAAASACRARCCRARCAIRWPIPGCSASPGPPGWAR